MPITVLSKALSPDAFFNHEEINHCADDLTKKQKRLADLNWPSFGPHDVKLNGQSIWAMYSDYYCSVLADTIKKFDYAQDLQTETSTFSNTKLENFRKKSQGQKVFFTGQSMLVTAKALRIAHPDLSICGFNPANEVTIGGGAFLGAPNYEEDLFRISSLGLALVKHARDNGDLHYKDGRPYYASQNKLNVNQAFMTKDVKVIKEINYRPDRYWYAKEFVDLPENEHFNLHFVTNAAIYLDSKRPFTAKERNETKLRIASHLSAMVQAGVNIALLTDFGCGGFNNPPKEVAEIYAELLYQEGYIDYFQSVHFNIVNAAHLETFQAVFNAPRVEHKNDFVQNKAHVNALLAKYIKRAKAEENHFFFFKKSRQASRYVNIALAESLSELMTNANEWEIGQHLTKHSLLQRRKDEAKKLNPEHYVDRGMNSDELQAVIEEAQKLFP